MSVESLIADVHAAMGTDALAWSIGAWHVEEHGTYPRFVWVPTVSRFVAPQRASSHAAGFPQAGFDHQIGFDVHVWGETLDDTIALTHSLAMAVRRIYGPQSVPELGQWDRGQATDRGWLVVVALRLVVPATSIDITGLTRATISGVGCDASPSPADGWIDCPCEEP